MTYEEAMHYIEDTSKYGSVLGLENIIELCRRLGNPQNKLKFVHIAGTNGKGSTGAYIGQALAEAGYKVGKYISPTIFSYRERIQFSKQDQDGCVKWENISKAFLVQCIEKIKVAADAMIIDGHPHPTPFEIETAMAFLAASEWNCDIVILEVGMGGRLDATNLVENVVCSVITKISKDHIGVLGNTLEQIASEKAGIIKQNHNVVTYPQDKAVMNVLKNRCMETESSCRITDFDAAKITSMDLEKTVFLYKKHEYQIHLLGEHQIYNACLAIEALTVLNDNGYPIKTDDIQKGLDETRWPGRMECISTKPVVLVDGAHNKDGAGALKRVIQTFLADKKVIGIMGVFRDKDYDGMLQEVGGLFYEMYTIKAPGERGLESEELCLAAKKYCGNVHAEGNVLKAYDKAIQVAGKDGAVVVFGSLSFIHEVLEQR